MLYEELTRKIIGCAIEVHKRLGNGFQEVIYQRALEIEMRFSNLDFSREMNIACLLPRGHKLEQEGWTFLSKEK